MVRSRGFEGSGTPQAFETSGGSLPRDCFGLTARIWHRPVLLAEVVETLAPALGSAPGSPRDGWMVDATVGGGGHAEALLERSGPEGRLLGLDVDDEALQEAYRRLQGFGDRVRLVRSSFRRLGQVLQQLGVAQVDAVLLDLGVSSHQLDDPARGFRFRPESADHTPLDMRMGREASESAAELLARADVNELEAVLRSYGELGGAGRLARAIADARREAPLRTARDLLSVVERTGVGRGRKHHPATLVFQALRIAVNDEIGALEEGLDAAIEALRPEGRLAVISYHSLEDRCVKRRFRAEVRGCICPPRMPVCQCGRSPQLRDLARRGITPGEEELAANPRARSARMRVAERLAAEDPS